MDMALAPASASPSVLSGVSLNGLAETVLPFRTAEYIGGFCEKLLGEGIAEPADLLCTSSEALETKLSTHAAFNFIEMADTLSLRSAVERAGRAPSVGAGAKDDPMKGCSKAHGRSERSRSRDGVSQRPRNRGGKQRRGRRSRSESPRCGDGRGQRDNSRPLRGRDRQAPKKPEQSKPELWAAIERGDQAAVLRLLQEGREPEERYSGWSPLMKAAEEDRVEIMRLLLEKGVDLEVVNKKGRGALSFAAAPSMKRPTPTGALRLLLEHGADAARKDNDGNTAKARAIKEKREEAVAIFEEFEAKAAAPR
mmetsp:Transcript_104643/g.223663  ORF Transcript_104643/g.223663 Transcript_104643/m.223663 type:complete len:309 (-) Transcript_104643:86-1012(-)